MKQVEGFWLPDGEQHLVDFLKRGPRFAGGPTYQIAKLFACLPWVKDFRHAVDIGAHAGLWSRPLAAMFEHVSAFEPVEEHRACWRENARWFNFRNVATMHEFALGDRRDRVSLHSGPNSSGDTYVQAGGEHDANMVPLDDVTLPQVDFMKIDCEGFEFFILKGGEKTIRRDRPCIIVEQKRGKGAQFGIGDQDAVKLLTSWGAQLRAEISGDFILSW